jgi:hypothetical protein
VGAVHWLEIGQGHPSVFGGAEPFVVCSIAIGIGLYPDIVPSGLMIKEAAPQF